MGWEGKGRAGRVATVVASREESNTMLGTLTVRTVRTGGARSWSNGDALTDESTHADAGKLPIQSRKDWGVQMGREGSIWKAPPPP